MSVKIPADQFPLLFKAAKVTAYKGKEDPTSRCVYLHSTRGESMDEPGETDYLVATTTDGSSHGQIAIEVDGQLPHPVLFDMDFVTGILSHVKTAQKKMKEECGKQAELTVELRLRGSEAGGETLVVQTLTDGFPGEYDTTSTTNTADYTDFPILAVTRQLEGGNETDPVDSDGRPLPEGNAYVLSSAEAKVASGIQAVLSDYHVFSFPQGHAAARRVLTCGPWRGSVPGPQYSADDDLDTPENPVYVPEGVAEDEVASGEDIPKEGASAVKNARADIETLGVDKDDAGEE